MHPFISFISARRPVISLLACLAMLLGALPASADHPDPLPDLIVTPNESYIVVYTNDNFYDKDNVPAGADLNYFPTSLAQVAADSLDENAPFSNGDPNGYHAGYEALLFDLRHPLLQVPTAIYNCNVHGKGCDNGSASPSIGIRLPADRYISRSPAGIRFVMGHELFHHVEYAYVGNSAGWGDASIEGMARMMEDKIYDDLDGPMSAAFYLAEINRYLSNSVGNIAPIWDSSYRAALFWNYLSEQYGNDMNEPHIGVDFIRTFWEIARILDITPNTPLATQLTLQTFDPNATISRVFRDFANANIAKEFTWAVPGYPADRFRYIDENDGNGVLYDPVTRRSSDDLSTKIQDIGVAIRWHAAYHEAIVQPECQGVVGFEARPDSPIAFSLLGIKNGVVESFTESKTQDFSRAWLQDRTDPYTRLVAVANGLDQGSAFFYTFACGPASVDVLWPTVKFQAFVGRPDAEEPFSIQVRVPGPVELGTPSVRGLEAKDFEVYVGGINPLDEATIVGFSETQGDYFIKAIAPVKTAAADGQSFPLIVRFGGWTDTEVDAIVYDEQLLDEMIVLDVSGSMADPPSYPKLDAAKVAAPAFVDILDEDDLAGFVTFAGNATLEIQLMPATAGHRDDIKSAIAGTSAFGGTSIGDGLAAARDEIITNGSVLGENWILLLSDGAGNEPLFYADVTQSLTNEEIIVHTVALGGSSDRPALERIANEHGGETFYVHDGEGPAPGATTSAQYEIDSSASVAHRLSDTYVMAWEDRAAQSRIWEVQGTVAAADSDAHEIVVTEGGLSRGRIAIVWDDPSTALDVTVYGPLGAPLADGVDGVRIFKHTTHTVIHKNVLAPGSYTVELSAGAIAVHYVGNLSGRTIYGADLDLFFAQVPDPAVVAQGGTFAWGASMPIKAMLTDASGPVPSASVTAKIRHPDGTHILLPLFDDGDHEDGNGGDGVYGNVYTRTTEASPTNLPDNGPPVSGTYQVRVVATGSSNKGESFARIRKGSFSVYAIVDPVADTDADSMPDVYEDEHSCLDVLTPDEGLDPDFDDLSNEKEWSIGTDPCYSDTDRGGESDASEVGRGANPFDPADDSITPPVDPIVVDWVPDHYDFYPLASGRNLIRYPSAPEWQSVRIWRSLSPTGPFVIIANVALDGSAFYADDSLTNGTTYYYMVQGEGLSGVTTAFSHVFSGTPKADPFANVGSIVINAHAPFTETTSAELTLNVVEPDVAQMRIANDADFTGALWQPYSRTLPWGLSPSATGYAQVFAQFRDGSQNDSRVYTDTIQVVPPNTLGRITGVARYVDQATHLGITMLTSDPNVTPANTNALGDVATLVLPGTYDVTFSADGYVSETLNGVVVTSGSTTDFGAVFLPEPASRLMLGVGCAFLGVVTTRRSGRPRMGLLAPHPKSSCQNEEGSMHSAAEQEPSVELVMDRPRCA